MIDQRSPEWFAQRNGKVTASRIAEMIAKTKTGYGAGRENYMAQLVVERITGQTTESKPTAAMQWGTDQEPFARAAYEAAQGVMVEEVGFIPHPTIPMSGASPDGLVGDDGCVEIKCPNTAQMIDALLTQSVPHKYLVQIQWQLACTGRAWADYVVFDPRMPKKAQLFVKRVERDQKLIDDLESEVKKFLAEVDEKVSKLQTLMGE